MHRFHGWRQEVAPPQRESLAGGLEFLGGPPDAWMARRSRLDGLDRLSPDQRPSVKSSVSLPTLRGGTPAPTRGGSAASDRALGIGAVRVRVEPGRASAAHRWSGQVRPHCNKPPGRQGEQGLGGQKSCPKERGMSCIVTEGAKHGPPQARGNQSLRRVWPGAEASRARSS